MGILKGKMTVVTGWTNGVRLAGAFAGAGAKVVLNGMSAPADLRGSRARHRASHQVHCGGARETDWQMTVTGTPVVPLRSDFPTAIERLNRTAPDDQGGGTMRCSRATMVRSSALALVAGIYLGLASPAGASSRFDGTWNLIFATQRGPCDPTYDFTVNVTDGHISHPNILTFRGRVTTSGAVKASVRVGGRYAWGSGRLSESSGRGVWTGRSGQSLCSGNWTAQRN